MKVREQHETKLSVKITLKGDEIDVLATALGGIIDNTNDEVIDRLYNALLEAGADEGGKFEAVYGGGLDGTMVRER